MSNNLSTQKHTYPVILRGADLYPLLKHRYPFLLLDAVEIQSSSSCSATRNVSFSDQCFVGHFPNHPVMPGVLQIEAMAQSACILSGYHARNDLEHITLFASIESAKFYKQVIPGDVLNITTELMGHVGDIAKFKSVATVSGEKVAEAKFMAALKPVEEYTFGIIKPNAFNVRDHILQILTNNGLKVASYTESNISIPAYHITKWSKETAAQFYAEHSARPFFNDLCDIISSGEIVTMVLRGHDAVAKWRYLMGATNPANADAGTIRALYGKSLDYNAAHGSDSLDSAKREIEIAFPGKFKL